jgi:hypothetical protein
MFFRAVTAKSNPGEVKKYMQSAGRRDAEGNFVLLATKYFGLVSGLEHLLEGAQIAVSRSPYAW